MKNTNNKRINYGFKLDFPATFTMAELRHAKRHTVKYITLRSRVLKAIKQGKVVIAGEVVTPNSRGRRPIIYRRVDAKITATTIPAAGSVLSLDT
jgi:hypothetical protein